jgi:uncharacterized membrane protein
MNYASQIEGISLKQTALQIRKYLNEKKNVTTHSFFRSATADDDADDVKVRPPAVEPESSTN